MRLKNQIWLCDLNAQLDANGGIIPDAWKPYIPIFVLALNALKIFTSDEWDKIIDKILAAIELLEN